MLLPRPSPAFRRAPVREPQPDGARVAVRVTFPRALPPQPLIGADFHPLLGYKAPLPTTIFVNKIIVPDFARQSCQRSHYKTRRVG